MVVGEGRRGIQVVDFEAESEEHSEEAGGIGVSGVVEPPMLYVGNDGKGKKHERKAVEKVW